MFFPLKLISCMVSVSMRYILVPVVRQPGGITGIKDGVGKRKFCPCQVFGAQPHFTKIVSNFLRHVPPSFRLCQFGGASGWSWGPVQPMDGTSARLCLGFLSPLSWLAELCRSVPW